MRSIAVTECVRWDLWRHGKGAMVRFRKPQPILSLLTHSAAINLATATAYPEPGILWGCPGWAREHRYLHGPTARAVDRRIDESIAALSYSESCHVWAGLAPGRPAGGSLDRASLPSASACEAPYGSEACPHSFAAACRRLLRRHIEPNDDDEALPRFFRFVVRP